MKTANNGPHRNYSYDFLWLSLGLLPLLFIALLLPATPYDYWWYLRLGRDVLQTGHVPTLETYSFTHAGEPIINQPWLSAVVMWLAYSNGGLDAAFLLRFICIGLAYGLIWIWMRQLGAGPRLASALIILAGAAGSNNWSLRPQMFAYPLFALILFLLWKWHKENSRFVWFVPLVALAWANLHDSFLILFILTGAALIFGEGNRRTLTLVISASFVATLITPYGITLWDSLIHSLISPLSWNLSTEWQPPTNAGWQMHIFFGWVLLFLPLASFSSRRLSILEWVWLIGLLWMSFSGIRYVIWGLLVLSAFSAALLAEWDLRWLNRPTQTVRPAFNYFLGAALLSVSLLALPGIRTRLGIKSIPVLSADTPVAATEWLSNQPELPGPLWSDLTFSSYLIFALPSRPVWIDTRFEMIYPAAQYKRYAEIASAVPDWPQLLERENINLLMLSKQGEPNLVEAARLSGGWCEEYSDQIAVIFSRKMSEDTCP